MVPLILIYTKLIFIYFEVYTFVFCKNLDIFTSFPLLPFTEITTWFYLSTLPIYFHTYLLKIIFCQQHYIFINLNIDGVPQERRRTVNPLWGKTEFLGNETIKVNPNGGKQGGIPEKESPGIANNQSDPNGRQK